MEVAWLLESVILDRGLQFVVGLTKELNKMLGIETKLSTAYHPQTNGQMVSRSKKMDLTYFIFIFIFIFISIYFSIFLFLE